MVNANPFSDYGSTNAGQSAGDSGGTNSGEPTTYWSLERLKRSYVDYLNGKTQEVAEQQESRRYRHASHWTADQIKKLNARKQPVVTYNRIGRKIDAVIGLIEKLRQSPKAYPRTPQEQQGADLATAAIRSVLDEQQWRAKSPIAAEDGAVDGIGGVELVLEKGDQGDPTIGFEIVEPDGFFYDPRSYKLDFSDARFLGQGKWVDMDMAKEMFPDKADDIESSIETGTDLSTNSDREQKWFVSDGNFKRVRLVDEWYVKNGEWYWCIYTGSMKLDEGKSYLHDEKGKTICKYVMFSANVDQDGDRYGFVRNLKSAQDEINQRRSKALHLLNTRRIIAERGAFDDIEETRREAVRPDGVVIRNKGFEAEFDDGAKKQEIDSHLQFLVDAKSEIENFGPNPALVGSGALGDKSGRAISLLQQAGIAELGPFILSYRGWKIRLYRAIWNAIREYWKAERWIRVTDDQGVPQFVGLNQVGIHPMTGMPMMTNQIGALDVDIILDEGPDSMNVMADTRDALMALAQSGAQVPPQLLIEASDLPFETKQKYLQMLSGPNPQQQAQMQSEMQSQQSVIDLNEAKAKLANAQAIAAIATVQQGPNATIQQPDNPAVIAAEIENKQADTLQKKAKALHTLQQTALAPQDQAHKQAVDVANLNQQAQQQQHQQAVDVVGLAQTQQQQQHAQQMDMASQEQTVNEPAPKKARKRKPVAEITIGPSTEEIKKQRDEQKANYDQITKAIAQSHGQIGEALLRSHQVLADALGAVGSKVDALSDHVNAPVSVERDKTGRVSAINKGNKKMTVRRDKLGRVEAVS